MWFYVFFSYPLCLSLQNSLLHNCNLIDTKPLTEEVILSEIQQWQKKSWEVRMQQLCLLKSWIQPRRKLARIMILGHGTCITASPSPDPRCAGIFITEFLSFYFNTSRYMPKYRVRHACQGILPWDTRAEPKIHSIITWQRCLTQHNNQGHPVWKLQVTKKIPTFKDLQQKNPHPRALTHQL